MGRLREVLRCLRKRLQSRHPRAVYLALTLTESLAKNCGVPLLQAMDVDEKFLPQMGKVAKVCACYLLLIIFFHVGSE